MTPQHKYDVKTMAQLAAEYAAYVEQSATLSVDLSLWLPGLRPYVRPLVPGELGFIMADTGTGKSMALQCISRHIRLPSVFFQLELPGVLMYERWMAGLHFVDQSDVENMVRKGMGAQLPYESLNHIVCCDTSRMSCEAMQNCIDNEATDALGGVRPVVCYVDYIGLMAAQGRSRYERVSQAAESLKVLARLTNTVVLAATQMHRLEEGEQMGLHSAKDSGSIESSCGLLVGMRRDDERPHDYCWFHGVKNTKGRSGWTVRARLNGARMTIEEDAITERTEEEE
jgi:replicative DNA helicase